jgi:uncharacterized membrane protein YidH (DUF202 family)
MYSTVLVLHSLIRWVVLLVGVAAAVRAIIGWSNNKKWTTQDSRLALGFTISIDLQLLSGLILYVFLSPWTAEAFRDFGAAIASDELRFFAVDHLLFAIVAVAMAHAGRSSSKRAESEKLKHKRAAILFTLAVAALLFAIPWSQPLLRLG